MKTLIALLALCSPVFAGWTYPSLASVYAQDPAPQDLPPCYIPPGGTPPGLSPPSWPAGWCLPSDSRDALNAQWTASCEVFTASANAWYEWCVTEHEQTWCQSEYDADVGAWNETSSQLWVNGAYESLVPCE